MASKVIYSADDMGFPNRQEVGKTVGQMFETFVRPVVEQSYVQGVMIDSLFEFLKEVGLKVDGDHVKLDEEELKAWTVKRMADAEKAAEVGLQPMVSL
jgi:hypothetical protein